MLVVTSQEILQFGLLYDSVCGLSMKIFGFSCRVVSTIGLTAAVPAHG